MASFNSGSIENVYSHGQQEDLPSYNNNYEQRFQTLQYSSNLKSTGMPMSQSYSAARHRTMSVNVFEVRFKCTKGDYLLTDSLRVKAGDFVKVEADRGYDIGIIFKNKPMIPGMEVPRKRILGHIGPEEMSILPHKMEEETQAVVICRQMAVQRGLLITIADVEFQFDRNKLTVIFSSEGRIDFRELVRDMFSFFRIRIWMQKVSPSEAVALMELAARDGDGSSVPPPPGSILLDGGNKSLDRMGSLASSRSSGSNFSRSSSTISRSSSTMSGASYGASSPTPPVYSSHSSLKSLSHSSPAYYPSPLPPVQHELGQPQGQGSGPRGDRGGEVSHSFSSLSLQQQQWSPRGGSPGLGQPAPGGASNYPLNPLSSDFVYSGGPIGNPRENRSSSLGSCASGGEKVSTQTGHGNSGHGHPGQHFPTHSLSTSSAAGFYSYEYSASPTLSSSPSPGVPSSHEFARDSAVDSCPSTLPPDPASDSAPGSTFGSVPPTAPESSSVSVSSIDIDLAPPDSYSSASFFE